MPSSRNPTQQQSLLKTSLLAQLPATAREPILAVKSEESDAVVLAVSVTSGQTLQDVLATRSATSLPSPSSSKRGSQWPSSCEVQKANRRVSHAIQCMVKVSKVSRSWRSEHRRCTFKKKACEYLPVCSLNEVPSYL